MTGTAMVSGRTVKFIPKLGGRLPSSISVCLGESLIENDHCVLQDRSKISAKLICKCQGPQKNLPSPFGLGGEHS